MFLPFLPGSPASSQLLRSPWFLPGFIRAFSSSQDLLWHPWNTCAPVSSSRIGILPRTIQPLLVRQQHPLHTRTRNLVVFSPAPFPVILLSLFGECRFVLSGIVFPFFLFAPLLNRPLGFIFPLSLCVGLLGSAHGSAPGHWQTPGTVAGPGWSSGLARRRWRPPSEPPLVR